MSEINNHVLVLDVESTLSTDECIPMLGLVAGGGELAHHLDALTNRAMDEGWDFKTSLEQRVGALIEHDLDTAHIATVARRFGTSPSVTEAAKSEDWFTRNTDNYLVVSGGFRTAIQPMLLELGIPVEKISANDFVFDSNGRVIGVNWNNPLSQDGGKAILLGQLGIDPEHTTAVGDGSNDLAIKSGGAAKYFGLYTENVRREKLARHPAKDYEFANFGAVQSHLGSMALAA